MDQARESAGQTYLLGDEDREQRRLDEQGANLRTATERLLREAGIGPAGRVLDVGCGTGDVALLAGALVGPEGAVLGIDRSAQMVRAARGRALARGLGHVRFEEADLSRFDTHERFDAVVGRLVLVHQPDPVAALRNLARLVRPGGVVAFAEQVVLPELASPPRPLYSRCVRLSKQALEAGGLCADTGLRLQQLFVAAGLPPPRLLLEGVVTSGPDPLHHQWLAQTVATLLPLLERHGLARAEELEVGTLARRLSEEGVAVGGMACGCAMVGAWAVVE
jgi:ubiquinone/menaquinone biosynthesis C-methylase UbiE